MKTGFRFSADLSISKMDEKTEQRVGFKTGKSAFGDKCLSRSDVFIWFNRFKNARESVDDDPQKSGRPSVSITNKNIAKIIDLVPSDH